MDTFNTTRLANSRVLVQGSQPEQRTVLDGSEWDAVRAQVKFDAATKDFDLAVEDFFAPLIAAADAASAAEAAFRAPKADPRSVITLDEGTEAVEGKPATVINLGPDATILRMIEFGHTDQLIWVGDKIELLDYVEPEKIEPIIREMTDEEAAAFLEKLFDLATEEDNSDETTDEESTESDEG